ncbi:MAG: hypothetical protein J1E64_09875 [Acetatifactor sp.]|nr:hypothetical protein [Acetatifactor sp.]
MHKISKLWSMLIWGNKQYVVEKLIADNGFDNLNVKGIGAATMSELLTYVDPEKYVIFNKTTILCFDYLDVPNMPKYNYLVAIGELLGFESRSEVKITAGAEKAQSNAAVQAVVGKGVIDEASLRTWDSEDVLAVYDSLARAHESINKLALVPESF